MACLRHHGIAKHHGGEDMEVHSIENTVWQHMPAALQTVSYMHGCDLDSPRRFVSACFAVMRTNMG